MIDGALRVLRRLFGAREITVESVSSEALVLRYGRTRTVFDRAVAQIRQNDKLVGMMNLVERVELHQPNNQEGTVNWYVTVRLAGARQIEVGQVTDTLQASTVGARIAEVTRRPVVTKA